MGPFIGVAALLTLLAAAAIAVPLLRPRRDAPPARISAAVSVLVLVLAAGLLYPIWSGWDWSRPGPSADDPVAMVGRLARRMERNPQDIEGWMMLGRSYAAMEQYPLSARAYQRADRLADGGNAEALMGLAEALVLGGQSALDGRAGHMFEQALELDPTSKRALFYAAIAALERGEKPVARDRFVKLLDTGPPPEVRQLIEEQVKLLETPDAASTAATPAAAHGPSIPLHVTLSPVVADKVAAGAPLFILARVPDQPGPPLAARRLTASFPLDVELQGSDAMVAGQGFGAGQELEIEARVANGGSAGVRSGDPFGTARVKVGQGGRITIEISQLKP